VNKLQRFAEVLDGIPPWSGRVPKGFLVDFLGVLTEGQFRAMFGVDPGAIGDFASNRPRRPRFATARAGSRPSYHKAALEAR
jgi:hypothetical protein